jgi:hypothetical protein
VKHFRSQRVHAGNFRPSASTAGLTEESPMKKSIFAALAVTAIISGTTAGAIRQSPQEQLATEEVAAPSITEIGSAPGWHITPAHDRMW